MTNLFKKIIYIFVVLLIGGVLLFLVVNWQLNKLRKTLSQNFIKGLEKMPMEEIQKKLFGETNEYKEFVTPDKKLKIKYLADWIEMPGESLENFNQEIIKKGAKILFFAQKIKVKSGAFAFLIIQELEKEKWKSIDEIIEETRKDIEERGGEMEIVKLKKEEGVFEAKYKKTNQPEIHSLEKILEGSEKIYLIVFLTFERNWPDFEGEANEILNSLQFNP